MNSAVYAIFTLALYIACGACSGAMVFLHAAAAPESQKETGNGGAAAALARPLLYLGIVANTLAVGALCITTHRSPFAGEYGTLVVSAWVLALGYVALDFRARLPALRAVAMLAASVIIFWAMIHSRTPIAANPILAKKIVSIHVLSTVISFGLFALAGGCAGLYLLQNNQLKARSGRGALRRLPALSTLDALAYHAVAYGLPLLTLGLALGISYVYRGGAPTDAWWLDPKTIVSFVVWLLYIVYLAARMGAGWRGVRLQYILLAGLVIAPALFAIPGPTHQFK